MEHAELAFLDLIQSNLRCAFMDTVMPLVSALGNSGMIWIIWSILLLLFPKSRKTGMAMAAGLFLEVLCCNVVLKPLIARARPCDVNTAVQLLISRPADYSFPSGHTGSSFAAASVLYFERHRCRFAAGILAVLIAFSRLYLYVHYPTDVLAGAVIGCMAGYAAYLILERIWRKENVYS